MSFWNTTNLRFIGACLVLVSALAGCSVRPDARVGVRTDVWATRQVQKADGGLIVDIDGFAVDAVPAGKPVTSVASLITGPVNEPMPGTSGADRVVLVAADALPPMEGEQAKLVTRLQSARLLIPAGWTGSAELVGPIPANPGMGLRLMIVAPVAGARPTLQVASHSSVDDDDTKGAAKPDEKQVLTLDWPLAELPGAFGIGIPAGPVIGSPSATVWRIAVSDAAADEGAREDIRAFVADAQKAGPMRGGSAFAARARSLRGATSESQRGVLAVAALGVGAELCAEVCTLAEPKEVSTLAGSIADAWDALPPEADSTGAAWAADRATMVWLGGLRAKGTLSKTMASTLAARFGEVGRDPATLADLASKSATAEDFRQRVIAEHLILLDDLAPGTRVRAYDWLVAAGAAPKGFDPLGPAKERRAAVDRHLESLAPKSP